MPAHPAFAPYRPLLVALGAGFPGYDALHRLSRSVPAPPVSALGAPIRFLPAAKHTSALAYERRILERGEVAVRSGDWHDLFNALAWLVFPRTKAVLNAAHCADATLAAGTRSRCRDALTLIDESGIVVGCRDPELIALWRARQWKRLFWDRRADVAASFDVAVVGHGVLAKLLHPFRGITARALIVDAPAVARLAYASLDAAAMAAIECAGAAIDRDALLPLPVAALPGWDAESLGAALFDDVLVFRPRVLRSQR